MRTVYKALAYIIAAEVVVQAMAAVYGIAGLEKWVEGGGVFEKSIIDQHKSPFPEVIAFPLHGLNGTYLIPLLAVLLLISSFFAKVPGGVKWAGLVLALVAVQVTLGYTAEEIPAIGSLHGLNALALFTSALVTGRRVARVTAASLPEAGDPVKASV